MWSKLLMQIGLSYESWAGFIGRGCHAKTLILIPKRLEMGDSVPKRLFYAYELFRWSCRCVWSFPYRTQWSDPQR